MRLAVSLRASLIPHLGSLVIDLFILNSIAGLEVLILSVFIDTYLSQAKVFLQRWHRLGRLRVDKPSLTRL